jgi:hypothetical protein
MKNNKIEDVLEREYESKYKVMFNVAKKVLPELSKVRKQMLDNLIKEGFTREEAVLIIAHSPSSTM